MELKDLGVDLPSSLGIKYLRNVYQRLTENQSVPDQQLDIMPATPAINSSPAGSSANTQGGDSPISELNEMRRQMLDLQSTVANINHRLNSSSESTTEQSASRTHSTGIQGIPIDTLPPINIVTPQLRKTILEKKHINLALLLLPWASNEKETRIIDTDGNQIVVKANDARLTRNLNIVEFRQAFSLYRNIMCEKEPERRAEFDAYFDFIESLHAQFGGLKFYDYHNAFSKKAALHYAQNKVVISWAYKDTDLYLRIFAGEKSRACEACNSMLHTTRFCPNSVTNSTNFNSGSSTKWDRKGRQRIFHQGKEICNNYNALGCNIDHGNSGIVHLCMVCKSASHSASDCPRKQSNNGTSKQSGAQNRK